MNIMDRIRHRQAQAGAPSRAVPAPQRPEMLYIGCVDARLDPIDDIGINKGAALIFRNIGALVLKDEATPKPGTIPANASIGAVLEFFIHHIPAREETIKHVVVSGHTDCGGLRACQREECGEGNRHLARYLESIRDVRDRVRRKAQDKGWDEAHLLREFEEESVRQSIRNLQTYPAVKRALKEGTLAIHGWVLDTATRSISEMDLGTLRFEPMALKIVAEREG